MPPELKSPVQPTKESALALHLAGIFFGAVTGLVFSAFLCVILSDRGVISGNDHVFNQFVIRGPIIGSILGLVFPRPLIAIGRIFG